MHDHQKQGVTSMIVLESNNPEELKIGWFAYVPKNRANSENWNAKPQ